MKHHQFDHARDKFQQMHRAVDAHGQQQIPDDGAFALIQEKAQDWERVQREQEQLLHDRAAQEQRQGRLF